MKKILLIFTMLTATVLSFAQRITDKLDRGLVAQKASSGVYVNWRVLAEEYYGVKYNLYRDGTKLNDEPLTVSNYKDASGTTSSTYTVAPVVRGEEKEQCAPVSVWASSYKEIKLSHEGIKSTLIPNDACCADVDGDGELEILMKFDNLDEMNQSYPKNGPKIDGTDTKEYSIFEVLKQNGQRLWWVNCGPNMGDFQNNEQNIVGYDWDKDGKAEVVMRLLEGSTIHFADGSKYIIGANGSNGGTYTNYRAATGGGTNWFMHDGKEFLVYCNGETGEIYQCIDFPLARLESGESDLNKAWGDGYGHRSNKFFFGAPYLDGRNPSIFLARGIYTRHKMVALDVDPSTHKLTQRWKWYNNTNGAWKGQGYHNYSIADVDWDGRDEIVFGSMVIDDNGKGLSTTALGHGDAAHCSDFNPYIHGQEIYACNEDHPGNNYRDATTSKIYHRYESGNDDGRAMMGNFSNSFPGSIGCSAREGAISSVTNEAVNGMDATGINTNFRIYWDADLCSETFNYINGKNTEGCVAKYGSWSPIYTCAGSLTNNDTKGTPCYQGDILGDWREEIIMRTADNNIRIYSTPTYTTYRIPTLWSDTQYRNAMVWQMCGYNQPPHLSYFLGKLEGITKAPPTNTMTGRVEVSDGGSVNSSLNGEHAIVCETGNSSISISDGAEPFVLTFDVPTWVQGSAPSECTNTNPSITYKSFTCDVTGGGLAGEARLVKTGDGVLNLPKADFSHSGETDIWAGTVNFDGSMLNSPLWLNRFAELNSSDGRFMSIKADYASVIRPGGKQSLGTISTDSLSLGFGSRIQFDIYSDGLAADKFVVGKYLSIEKKTGTAWTSAGPEYLAPVIELIPHLASGQSEMAAGKYVLAELGEELKGSVDNIIIEGLETTKKSLYIEDNKLILEIQGLRQAASVIWTGSENSTWDLATTKNFIFDSGSSDATMFVSDDAVLFNDDAKIKTVNIKENVSPSTFTVNNSSAYTFSGSGAISGNTKFIKEGEGSVTMKGNNSYTGGNTLKGGTTIVSLLSNQYSDVGNLGGITKAASKFTMQNGAVLQTTAAVEMGSPVSMVGTDGGVLNIANDFKMDASFSGTVLTKKGSGCLFLNASNSNLSSLVLTGGSVALAGGSQPKSIELQGGTIYDDAQNTTHGIVVPEGKTGYWHLTGTYYTAYSNKVTGKGTLVINPRNTVSRVRITGDWSAFEGTIKHTNKDIWLPLDASGGLAKGTLNLAEGCTATNTAKSFTIGKLTGKGSLAHPVANFQNSNAISGSNTWKVGNSSEELGDFTFDGTMLDWASTNKCNFEKIGSCKMTISKAWENSGTVKITAGELHANGGVTLGTGALTVAKGATFSAISGALLSSADKNPMTNSSFTINGTVQVGTTATAVSGMLNFGSKNVTFNSGSTLRLGVRGAVAGTSIKNAYIYNIGKLTMNGTISLFLKDYEPAVGDEIRIWNGTTSFSGSPKVECDTEGYTFDLSKISEGILIVSGIPTAIANIPSSEIVSVEVLTIGGAIIDQFTCPMGAVISTFKQSPAPSGLYMLRISSPTIQITQKLLK